MRWQRDSGGMFMLRKLKVRYGLYILDNYMTGKFADAEGVGGYQIRLDHRPVRTPNRDVLTIPASKPHLAHAIALEWDLLMSAKQALKNHLIPLTSLVARAGDVAAEDAKGETMTRQEIVQTVLRFLDTDTLLTWAPERSEQDATLDPHGESLRQLQIRTARPITAFLATRVWPGTEFRPVLESDSILPVHQAPETVAVVRGWISSLPPFELAGLERAVLASKSLLVAVRLVVEWSEVLGRVRPGSAEATAAAVAGDVGEEGGVFGIEEAAQAATLEVGWQTSQWGEVEDTHDVDREDVRRQLGSTVLLVSGTGGQ